MKNLKAKFRFLHLCNVNFNLQLDSIIRNLFHFKIFNTLATI